MIIGINFAIVGAYVALVKRERFRDAGDVSCLVLAHRNAALALRVARYYLRGVL